MDADSSDRPSADTDTNMASSRKRKSTEFQPPTQHQTKMTRPTCCSADPVDEPRPDTDLTPVTAAGSQAAMPTAAPNPISDMISTRSSRRHSSRSERASVSPTLPPSHRERTDDDEHGIPTMIRTDMTHPPHAEPDSIAWNRDREGSEEEEEDRAWESYIMLTSLEPESPIVYVSPSVKDNLGFEPEEMMGKSSYAFLHPDGKRCLMF